LMLQNGPAVATTTGVFLGGNLLANFFVKFSLHSLLEIINTIQIILYLPLYRMATPGNTQIFFSFLMQIASFDYFPSDLVYTDFYPKKPDPINENFNSSGFSTTLILFNLGSLMLAILSFPALIVYLWATKHCLKNVKNKKCKKYFANKQKTLRQTLFWGQPLLTYTEAYAVLSMATLIQFKYMDFTHPSLSFSVVLSIGLLVLVISLPIVVTVILLRNWENLDDKDVR